MAPQTVRSVVGYFKERNTFQVPALLFITLALKLTFINHPATDTLSQPGGLLADWLSHSIFPKLHPGFLASLGIVIQFLSALYANSLLAAYRMFSKSNLLVALSMLLFTSLFPASNQFSATTLLLPLLILFFQQIARLYNAPRMRPVIINIGMIMGFGYLMYHPFIWLLPCCFIGLAGMRPFRIAEWLLLLLGILTPVYFLLSYEFISGQWNPGQHILRWHLPGRLPQPGLLWWIGIGAAAIWLMAGISGWQTQMRRMLIQGRKNWYQLIFIGFFILLMGFLPQGNLSESLTLLSFPAASLASNAFFNKEKSLWPVLLFWLLVIAAAMVGWLYNI